MDYEKLMETCGFVFTYGTLRQGYGNSRILSNAGAECLGERTTSGSYLMGDVGFPYVFDPDTTEGLLHDEYYKPVTGDLWTIPSVQCFKSLDSLEGYPWHYDREVITLNTGEEAWMYIQPDPSLIHRCYQVHDTDQPTWNWSRQL